MKGKLAARSTFLLSALLLMAVVVPAVGLAQDGKVALTHDAYDTWRSIRGVTLSDDGVWLLHAEVAQDADSELVIRNLASGAEHRHELGYLTAESSFVSRIEAGFAPDGRHVVFLVAPDKATVEAAEEEELKGDDAPKKSLAILDLASGEVDTIPRVKSYRMPEEGGNWVAYLMENPLDEMAEGEVESAEAPEAEPAEPEEEQGAEDDDGDEAEDKEFGTELRVRWLHDGSELHEVSVLDYLPVDDGSRLLYVVSSEEAPDSDGVYALDAAARSTTPLWTGEGNYRHLALAEESDRYAFVSDTRDYASDAPAFELFGGTLGEAASVWVSHDSTVGFPQGMAVSDKEGVTLSDDGAVVMFGIRDEPVAEDDEADRQERARFDLWHWQDPYPQPQQLQVAEQVRNETWESVWWIDEERFVQLADRELPDVRLSADGRVAFGTSDFLWSDRHSYEGFFDDAYVVDTATGERTRVAERLSWGAEMSPDGRWVTWFGGDGDWIGYDKSGGGGFAGGQDWFVYDVESGASRNLTENFEFAVERHDWDTPNLPAPYGDAGFTSDGSAVVLYDRYDIWLFPLDGSEPTRLTDGVGRENGITFRWVRTDPEGEGVPADGPLLLSSTHEATMATGFWVDRIDTPALPVELIGADARLDFVDLADGADTFAFTRETFSEYPDVWVGSLEAEGATPALTDVSKVTDLGSQTDPYLWGEAELREFRSLDGLPLKGILVKPENFDPSKKYPLMVYIYETLHQGLHSFRDPSPGTSINPAYYVSNGYVLWMPDIEYVTPGYPGKDALKCVLPGVNMLVAEGWVDEDAIGIQGHSWGGYQIAYMLTQTDIFAAAESGAPVSNMTSAYGGIRWASGLVRQFQYERTQSRLGASLWEVPLRYVENSPLFWADEIDTPVLILHNDDDGAVPWYQGIELIMALRRLEKEAYMFNYNGEAHGLRQRINQEDWTVRMQEFFDHHLRGAPAPDWMTEGIRGWEKGEVDR